jgi:hypothetical protein
MLTLLKRTSLLLFFITIQAYANIGLVTDYSGSAAIERDEGFEVYDVENDLAVQMMDVVNTAKGKVRIEFLDETLVDITEHSRLLIDDFVYDPATGEGSLDCKEQQTKCCDYYSECSHRCERYRLCYDSK